MDNKLNKSYINKIRHGDTHAFEELVQYNTPFVMSVCLSLMKNKHDAEDACQEVFLKVWKSLSRFREESAFTTYLYTVSRNTCLDILKKNSKNECEEIPEVLADGNDTPEEQYIKHEFNELLEECLNALEENMRTVLLLREKAGLSYTEIAETLLISEGTVKSRISRAREKLLKLMKEKNAF